jgi:hypothetical protein
MTVEPELRDIGGGHFVACHHPLVSETPVAVGATATS